MDYSLMVLRTLADANRKLGELRGEKCFTDYADLLDNQCAVIEAEVVREGED